MLYFDIFLIAVFFYLLAYQFKVLSFKKQIGIKKVRFHFLIFVYVLLTGVFAHFAEGYVSSIQRDRLLSYAPSYAWIFEQMGHEKINSATSENDELYLRLLEYQVGWQNSNHYIADIYTMRMNEKGQVVLLVDSETDYDHDGTIDHDREMRTRIGEVYEKELPELKKAFSGHPSFTNAPYKDKWGHWVSAFVPMKDKNGKIDAVLGLDYPAKEYLNEIKTARYVVFAVSILGFFCVLFILSARLRRNEFYRHLSAALKQAKDAARVKSEFLANMSHEIRTPLNGILGIVNLMADQRLSGELKEQVRILKNCGDDLLNLVNDILDFSKIEAGKIVLESTVFNLHEAIDDVVELLKFRANEKGLKVESIKEDIPKDAAYVADVYRFRQVLLNLLSNAIKFTPSGSVTIRVRAIPQDEQSVKIEVSVKDTGIGINEDGLKLLFKSFSQVDGSTTKRFGGTGLGLAISKGIVESMGGSIAAHSKEGDGTTFTFDFVAQIAGEVIILGKEGSSVLGKLGIPPSLRVLVADDHSTNRLLATKYLEKIGIKADCVANGLEALDAISLKRYEVVFMDCQMPEMDGFETTKKIHERLPQDQRPWIIALTASALAGDREKCLAAGMNDFVSKPFNSKVLMEALMRVKFSKKVLDENLLLKNYRDEEDILYALISDYLRVFPELIKNLQLAVENADANGVRQAAHKLKGGVSHFYVAETVNDLAKLEDMGLRDDLTHSVALFSKILSQLQQVNLELQALTKTKAA